MKQESKASERTRLEQSTFCVHVCVRMHVRVCGVGLVMVGYSCIYLRLTLLSKYVFHRQMVRLLTKAISAVFFFAAVCGRASNCAEG